VSEAADLDNVTYIRNGPIGPVPDPNDKPSWTWRFFLAEILIITGMGIGMLVGIPIGYGMKIGGSTGFWIVILDSFVAGMLTITLWRFYMLRWVRRIINGEDR
jgi:hypothetical protein